MDNTLQLRKYMESITDSRVDALLKFHDDHVLLMEKSQGSSNNHQAWVGGYIGHILECCRIADNMYTSLSQIRELGFSLNSALIVLYFHDVEKIWKYTTKEIIDKENYYYYFLSKKYQIIFTKDERNALQYTHGEGVDYSPKKRVMSPLAAFCHCVDTISARIWFDYPK